MFYHISYGVALQRQLGFLPWPFQGLLTVQCMDEPPDYVSTDIVPNESQKFLIEILSSFLISNSFGTASWLMRGLLMHASGNVTFVTKRLNNELFTKQNLGFTLLLSYPICGPIFMDYQNVNLYSIPFSYADVLQRQLEFPVLAIPRSSNGSMYGWAPWLCINWYSS